MVWLLVAATSGVAAFFTMLYGLHYGRISSLKWLISMAISFVENVFVIQPLKVRTPYFLSCQLPCPNVSCSFIYAFNKTAWTRAGTIMKMSTMMTQAFGHSL